MSHRQLPPTAAPFSLAPGESVILRTLVGDVNAAETQTSLRMGLVLGVAAAVLATQVSASLQHRAPEQWLTGGETQAVDRGSGRRAARRAGGAACEAPD